MEPQAQSVIRKVRIFTGVRRPAAVPLRKIPVGPVKSNKPTVKYYPYQEPPRALSSARKSALKTFLSDRNQLGKASAVSSTQLPDGQFSESVDSSVENNIIRRFPNVYPRMPPPTYSNTKRFRISLTLAPSSVEEITVLRQLFIQSSDESARPQDHLMLLSGIQDKHSHLCKQALSWRRSTGSSKWELVSHLKRSSSREVRRQ